MSELPAGTTTFLMTDVEGSTHLWEFFPAAMSAAMARHDALIAECVERHEGRLIRARGEGDSSFTVFRVASHAASAAVEVQRALQSEPWPPETPLRVRMALHTGDAELRDRDYYGSCVNRCARLRSLAYGGQILLSERTAGLASEWLPVDLSLQELGLHRLKDLLSPERVFQLRHPELPHEFPPLRSLDTLPTNLPQQLTRFIGREEEIEQARAMLGQTRLLTLTAAGGAGKTRLALHVAAELVEDYTDGVWLVELAAVAAESLAPQSVAKALGVREEPGRDLTDTLRDWLRSKELLLVLDNCEHLVGACAALAETLLRACPRMRILATSREALSIPGEAVLPLPPLRVPSLRLLKPIRPELVETLAPYESVQLFVDRACAVQPSFKLTDRNAPAVVQICCLLDGLPLAIELAAARVKALSAEQIAARLDRAFHLLTNGSRTALPRQQTLRALIDWSHDLLSEPERILLRRLSVFAGGWTLEAAEAVCSEDGVDPFEVLDLLAGLVGKSLVVTEDGETGETRYRLLETIRHYACEKLEASGEASSVRGRHRDWCLALAEQAEPELQGPDQALWLDRLETEHDNLRAALCWTLTSEELSDIGLRMGAALWMFWYVRGHTREGHRWLEQILDRGPTIHSKLLGKALNGAGNLSCAQGDFAIAEARLHECLVVNRSLGDQKGIAAALNNLGLVASSQEDHAKAQARWEESLSGYRRLNYPLGVATTLSNLGALSMDRGDLPRAQALFDEALELQRCLGNKWLMAVTLRSLGEIAYHRGNLSSARELCREALRLDWELGAMSSLPLCLSSLAIVERDAGDCEHAAFLIGASAAARTAIDIPFSPPEQAEHEHHVSLIRASLPEEAFTSAWSQGQSKALEQVIEQILGRSTGQHPSQERVPVPAKIESPCV